MLLAVILSWLAGSFGLTTGPAVLSALRQHASIRAIVEFEPFDLSSILPMAELLHSRKYEQSMRQLIYNVLNEHAAFSQRGLSEHLQRMNTEFESFWIDNSLHISRLNQSLHDELLKIPSLESANIQVDRVMASIERKSITNVQILQEGIDGMSDTLSHLLQLNMPKAWRHSNGSAEIVVATIDTGVQYDHPALLASYRGTRMSRRDIRDNDDGGEVDHRFAWLESRSERKQSLPYPHDPHGHGTHTMGSMVGLMENIRLGTAPGLSWMTARSCDADGCLRSDLTNAAQWVMCPHGQCAMGARVVSNSWGASQPSGMGWFERIVAIWHAAGLLAVFAAGNAGPTCQSVFTPATLSKVLAVGAVNQNNHICSFSSRATIDSSKPDVMAPGLAIMSSYPEGRYAEMSGTSMACPLVAGIAGLLLSVNPDLLPDQIMDILRDTADASVVVEDNCCPNGKCAYGAGIVDAGHAIDELRFN